MSPRRMTIAGYQVYQIKTVDINCELAFHEFINFPSAATLQWRYFILNISRLKVQDLLDPQFCRADLFSRARQFPQHRHKHADVYKLKIIVIVFVTIFSPSLSHAPL